MSVRGWAPTDERGPALLLPKNALLRNNVGFYVYVVRDAGPDAPPIVTPQPEDILYPEREHFVIQRGGLNVGDRVVTEGNERLYPTAPVQPIETAALPTPARSNASTSDAGGDDE